MIFDQLELTKDFTGQLLAIPIGEFTFLHSCI